MDFRFTDQQAMFRDMSRKFAQRELMPLAAEHAEALSFPPQVILQMTRKTAALGLLGAALPIEYGGLGLDWVTQVLIVEEVARLSGSAAEVLAVDSLCSIPVNLFGTEAQKKESLGQICRGEGLGSVAFTEPATGADPKAITTRAALRGDEYVINGTKRFITGSNVDGPIVIFAKDSETEGGNRISAFLTRKNIPGYKTSPPWRKIGMHGPAICDIYFEDMRIPASSLLGEHGQGYQVLLDTIAINQLNICAGLLGLCQAAYDESVKYAQERMVKGKPITQFQTVQSLIADIAVGLEVSRSQLYRFASVVDSGDTDELHIQARVSRIFISETATELGRKALRVHGAYGYTEDFKVGTILRDMLYGEIIEGIIETHRVILAARLLEKA